MSGARAYYNDNDPFCVAWLMGLIRAGLIADGDVDNRSIQDVTKNDLKGYRQCHFFAGIGGWSHALRLSGTPDDFPVWTGSCPCQPFSQAGKHRGAKDARHLWPELRRLISECNPSTVFGEQVASPDGRLWLSGVFADLEAMGYRGAGADLCAAGIGAPHIRQRLYWVADSQYEGPQRRVQGGQNKEGKDQYGYAGCGEPDSGLSYPERGGLPRKSWGRPRGFSQIDDSRNGSRKSFWSNSVIIPCADGKARRIKPGLMPLAHGISNRVGLIRGYGNAIVPQVAAEFIQAFFEARKIERGKT